jgi:hypothetical protein
MPGAIEYRLDCPNKEITIRWKVIITGSGSNGARSDALQAIFQRRFNPNPPFKIGTCKVKFELDVEERLGSAIDPGLIDGDRDIIDIEPPTPGGGGHTYLDAYGRRRTTVQVNPAPNGVFVEWKLVNELGHAFGVEDTGRGLDGEWNLDNGDTASDRILPRHIETMLNKAPEETKREINRCCGAQLKTPAPDKKVQFPKKPFKRKDPRDAMWEIFPPGSENPFAPGYEAKMKRWQALVEKYGLTEAYRRWTKSRD